MLRMQNLSKVYRTHMIETHALRGFEINVKQGDKVVVAGTDTFANAARVSINK